MCGRVLLRQPEPGDYGSTLSGPQCGARQGGGTLQAVEPVVRLNAPSKGLCVCTAAKYFIGSIHPRLKRPAGRRLGGVYGQHDPEAP